MKTKSKTTRTIDMISMIWTDFLSVPKTIGIGPIMTAPPPLTFVFQILSLDRTSQIMATNAIAKPKRVKATPMLHKNWSATDFHFYISRLLKPGSDKFSQK